MISKKKRIKELEAELEARKTALRESESALSKTKEELFYTKDRLKNVTLEYEKLEKVVDDLRNGINDLPEGCNVGPMCQLCVHHKHIYSRLIGGSIDVCDIVHACPNFMAAGHMEVKNDQI
jgi:DNA repair exonuclease SbcCD ATPase subunit